MKKELTRVEKLKQELKLAMNIEKRNKDFKKLSKAEKRVAIAKDVIAALKAKKYIAETGDYLDINYSSDNYDSNINQELLCSNDITCKVCAVGALFTSKVIISNNFDSDYVPSDDVMRDELSAYFSKNQLYLIEAAFEGWETDEYSKSEIILTLKNNDHMRFHRDYDTNDRMIAIMNNIVKNKGTFKP